MVVNSTRKLVWQVALLVALFASFHAHAQDIKVMSSGGFSAAYKVLAPQFVQTVMMDFFPLIVLFAISVTGLALTGSFDAAVPFQFRV